MTNPAASETQTESVNSAQQTAPSGNASGMPRPLSTMPRLKLFSLVIGLFIYPRLAILNARVHCLWFRTLFIIIGSAVIASIIQAAMVAPEIGKQCDDIAQRCATILQSITYHSDTQTFSWGNEKLTLPFTQSTDGFRIDVIADKNSFDRKAAVSSDDDSGIFFSPQNIGFWTRNAADENYILLVDNLPKRNLQSFFKQLGESEGDAFTLKEKDILQVGSGLEFWFIVFCAVKYIFIYFQMIFTCVVIFIIMSLLFNRIDKAPFTAVIASSFACVIPPFLLTLVASLFPQIPVDIDTLFTVFFVIYLIVIFFDKSVILKRPNKD